jgi:hypothetical protein
MGRLVGGHGSWLRLAPTKRGPSERRPSHRRRGCLPSKQSITLLLFCLLANSGTRFPDGNSHSRWMSRTNAPWDTMLHLSWLGCEPARCLSGTARGPDSSGRWALGTDADCVRFSAADVFRFDAHGDMRRETQRQTCPRRWSKLQVPARTRTDTCRWFFFTTKAVSTRGTSICMHGLVTGQGVPLAYAMEGAVQDDSCAGSAIDRPRC